MRFSVSLLSFLLVAPAAVVLLLILTRGRSMSLIERILLVACGPAMGFSIFLTCVAAIDSGTSDWSAAKLAPIIALVRGAPNSYPLYENPGSGVLSAWIYGPVPAILFLPAAVWSTPTPALLTAIAINLACFFVPMIWIVIHVVRKTDGDWFWVPIIMSLFVLNALDHASLHLVAFVTSSDAPAIGLAALSCVFMMGQRTLLRMALAALCAALSVWSKQTLLPFLIVIPAYLWLFGNRREFSRYLLLLAGAMTIVSLVMIVFFGPPSNMWFNMVTIVSADPWQTKAESVVKADPMLRAWLGASWAFAKGCGEAIAILLAALIASKFALQWSFNWQTIRAWASKNPWIVLVMSGAALIPPAILGTSIVGGYTNHVALTNYFLIAAELVVLIRLMTQTNYPRLAQSVRCLVLMTIMIRATVQGFESEGIFRMLKIVSDPSDNTQETIFTFLQKQPHAVYFPWNPLPAVLNEGKLYHFEWGAIDRELAGIKILPRQIRAHMPENASYIAFRTNAQSKIMLKYFPQLNLEMKIPELPGFNLYAASANSVANHHETSAMSSGFLQKP